MPLRLVVARSSASSFTSSALQNAFKFTQRHTEVSFNAYAAADRIRIDVENHCGGLPQGAAEDVFLPFKQSGAPLGVYEQLALLLRSQL